MRRISSIAVLLAAVLASCARPALPDRETVFRTADAGYGDAATRSLLTAADIGRLCLSGEVFDLSEEQWNLALQGIRFYQKVSGIIRDGRTTVIETPLQDYTRPMGYQVVLRECEKEALLIVHTFEGGANPDLTPLLGGWEVKEAFGSDLTSDFQGKVFLLERPSSL